MQVNKEELNAYLQSIGGLKNGWYDEAPPILTTDFFEVSEGWYGLIKNLIEELVLVGWDKEVAQVKEKFGGLRFYIGEGNDEIFTIITKYERLSETICELCGAEGKLRYGGWIKSLCDKHSIEK